MRPTDHRNDAGTTGEGGPAIPASVAALDGLRTTDADRRSITKRNDPQLMLAAVWPGQGQFP